MQCDQCRLRKIRCDKQLPCSNCRNSRLSCRSTGAGRKPREQQRRILISSQYERKIDLIEERLVGIEQAIRSLKRDDDTPRAAESSLSFQPTPVSMKNGTTVDSAQIIRGTLDQHEPSSPFEGNSSLAAHSAYASQFLETAVSSSLRETSPKMKAALSTLRQLVSMQAHPQLHSGVRFPNQKPLPEAGVRDLSMPPMEATVKLLRQIKGYNVSSFFSVYCPFISIEGFTEKCRRIYFCTEDYSDTTFIVVNSGLYNMFMDCGFMSQNPAVREEYRAYVSCCRNNLETALANLNLLLPATMETVEALILGSMHAIEVSKPSFGWTLTSTALQICQTLGYHRASSMQNDEQVVREGKQRVFWSAYVLNRALSLRLGRASAIQDYDISIPNSFGAFSLSDRWKEVYSLWVKLASIQGKVYELLYSPAALCQPEEDRVVYARRLAAEMNQAVMQPFEQLRPHLGHLDEIDTIFLTSDEISRLSVLTLIYRAIPPPAGSPGTFSADCVDTARAALHRFHESMRLVARESDKLFQCSYMHWTVLYAPFVPFIVIFCHVIEGSDTQDDLARLTEFVASLEPLCSLSEAINKLHRLCAVLSSVATLYIEAQAQKQEDETLASIGQEFDTYLSALGLATSISTEDNNNNNNNNSNANNPTNTLWTNMMTDDPASAAATADPATQLGNWFSGNQYMMGLLEGDFEPLGRIE
ncbi:hypothetical protein ASPZODRAFT_60720 [Penicilliopsis zonata CBS 506.65]|uniref:Zn(2)-C6 fungal-type domain-containing protein n=1 Tax=Penicilliopsis zonata CBS 506.65 TaxID=1073090 RepID=A0A1L9SPH6_9EURO|nr:hypothetical protein ASPZODRAFT_60720 [Penicilliopsis zonata CBS 506.65]OJJ48964.1 hypothetical protein ASPZODRAFT_60720 [Penicilliopsis zonata CBS 506.65]